jgi:hypothetical protein
MHRIILVAGSIIASSLGFVLTGYVLSEAIRNSRRKMRPQRIKEPRLAADNSTRDYFFAEPSRRGYDTPELHRDDNLARMHLTKTRDAR